MNIAAHLDPWQARVGSFLVQRKVNSVEKYALY